MKPPRDSSCLLRSSAAARRFSSCCSSLVCSSSMDWRCRTRSSILLSSALLVVAPAVAGTAAAAGGETKSCSEPEFETGIAGLACREYKAKAFHGSASSQSFPQRATTMATMARRLNMAFFAQQASETVSVSKIYRYGHSHRRPGGGESGEMLTEQSWCSCRQQPCRPTWARRPHHRWQRPARARAGRRPSRPRPGQTGTVAPRRSSRAVSQSRTTFTSARLEGLVSASVYCHLRRARR